MWATNSVANSSFVGHYRWNEAFFIMKQCLPSLLAGAILILGLSRSPVAAQGTPDFANLDPQQIEAMIQERVVSFLREQLVVTNDAEWGVLEVRLSKVVKLKMETFMAMRGPGMGGMVARFAAMMPLSPESQALQRVVESKAPPAEIKAALAKFLEARKRKQAELERAQADLRQLLTLHQEGQLVLIGVLE